MGHQIVDKMYLVSHFQQPKKLFVDLPFAQKFAQKIIKEQDSQRGVRIDTVSIGIGAGQVMEDY